MTISAIESTLTVAGDLSTPFEHQGGAFNLKISGTFSGTIDIERAFSAGEDIPGPDDWEICTNDLSGTQVQITTPINQPAFDPEEGVWYRAKLSALSGGGPITVRFSR